MYTVPSYVTYRTEEDAISGNIRIVSQYRPADRS